MKANSHYTLLERIAMWIGDHRLLCVIVAVAVIALILYLLRCRNKKRNQRTSAPPVAFVPVENSGDSIEGTMLSPEEQIVSCTDALDETSRQRLIDGAPESLGLIVRVYDRCSPTVRQELAEIVRSQKMMEDYASRLKDGAAQGVLMDAWRLFPNDDALRSFVDMLASPEEETQLSGVKLLSAMKEPKMLPMLVLALVRPEEYPPARVAEVFLSMPRESASLLTYILPELNDKHKRSVLEIVAQAGVNFDPENVLACLDHQDLRIRTAAMLALGSGHITQALPQLLAAANDKTWQVRAAAAKALGLLGDSRAVPVLDTLTHDKEGWVAEAARQAVDGFYNS